MLEHHRQGVINAAESENQVEAVAFELLDRSVHHAIVIRIRTETCSEADPCSQDDPIHGDSSVACVGTGGAD